MAIGWFLFEGFHTFFSLTFLKKKTSNIQLVDPEVGIYSRPMVSELQRLYTRTVIFFINSLYDPFGILSDGMLACPCLNECIWFQLTLAAFRTHNDSKWSKRWGMIWKSAALCVSSRHEQACVCVRVCVCVCVCDGLTCTTITAASLWWQRMRLL